MKFLQKYFPFYEARGNDPKKDKDYKALTSLPGGSGFGPQSKGFAKSSEFSKPWVKGYVDRKKKIDIADNPYKGTEFAKIWEDGWNKGEFLPTDPVDVPIELIKEARDKNKIGVPKKLSPSNILFLAQLEMSDAFNALKKLDLKYQKTGLLWELYPNTICGFEEKTGNLIFGRTTGSELSGYDSRIKKLNGKFIFQTIERTDPTKGSKYQTGIRKVVHRGETETEKGVEYYKVSKDFDTIDDCLNYMILYALSRKAKWGLDRNKVLNTIAANIEELRGKSLEELKEISASPETSYVNYHTNITKIVSTLNTIYNRIGIQFFSDKSAYKNGDLGNKIKESIWTSKGKKFSKDYAKVYLEDNVVFVDKNLKAISGSFLTMLLNRIGSSGNYTPIKMEFLSSARQNWEEITPEKITLNVLSGSQEHSFEVILFKLIEYYNLYGLDGTKNKNKEIPEIIRAFTIEMINYLTEGTFSENIVSGFIDNTMMAKELIISQEEIDIMTELSSKKAQETLTTDEQKLLEDIKEKELEYKIATSLKIDRPALLNKNNYLLFDRKLKIDEVLSKINDKVILAALYYALKYMDRPKKGMGTYLGQDGTIASMNKNFYEELTAAGLEYSKIQPNITEPKNTQTETDEETIGNDYDDYERMKAETEGW